MCVISVSLQFTVLPRTEAGDGISAISSELIEDSSQNFTLKYSKKKFLKDTCIPVRGTHTNS